MTTSGRARPRVTHVLGGRGGFGGAERVVAAIVRSTGGRTGDGQHEVVLPFAHREHSADLLRALGDVPVDLGGFDGAADLPAARRWVARRLRRGRPDVVHGHLFHASVLVASLGRATPARVLTHHHGSLFEDQGRRWHRALDRWASRRFDRVVAVSGAVSAFLVEAYGFRPSDVDVIHNGWEGTPHPRVPPRVDFLSLSHLRAEKGHEVLLDAFALVRSALPQVRLRLVGDGPLRDHLRGRVADLGVADAVEFRGAVPDVWPHLAEATIVVVPSLTEPQGIAVLEAMASGCPLVATRVGGIPEMVTSDRNGLLVPPGDARALADAMVRLHTSPELQERYRQAGRETAGRWTMERTVERYQQLYAAVAAGARRGSTDR